MKRKRAYLKSKLKVPLAKETIQNSVALVAKNHEAESKKTTSPRTSSIMRGRQTNLESEKTSYEIIKSYPNALSDIISTVIKEITKEAGGLANLSRSLVDNSKSNGRVGQPLSDKDLEENESQPCQNPEYKQEELKAALKVIKKTMKLDAAGPFNTPVDPIALGIPDYFDIIETPMDFGTISNDLKNGLKYMNSADVFKDVEYIWYNCVKYNKKGDCILELMKRVKTYFMRHWKKAGLQTEPLVEEKDHPPPLPATSSHHLPPNEAPHPINMQSSNLSESSEEQDGTNTDSTVVEKKKRFRGPTRCIGLLKNTTGRIKVMTNELGQPVGPEGGILTSFVGLIARDGDIAPVTCRNWSKMPEENKEKMWQKVLTKFDINLSCRRWVLLSLRNKWRTFKSRLKANHYDVHETDEERLADRDERVTPEQWSALVSYWSSERWQNVSAINKATRARVKFSHTSGKKSFARIREEERAKRPDGQEPSQAELFILTRTRKNGEPVNEATAAVISQLRESSTQEDAYNQIMGKDNSSSCVSLFGLSAYSKTPGTGKPTRAECIKMVDEKNTEVHELKKRLASVEETCSQMAAQVSQLVSVIATMQNKGSSSSTTPRENSPNHVEDNLVTPNRSEPDNLEVAAKHVEDKLVAPNRSEPDNLEVTAKQVEDNLVTPNRSESDNLEVTAKQVKDTLVTPNQSESKNDEVPAKQVEDILVTPNQSEPKNDEVPAKQTRGWKKRMSELNSTADNEVPLAQRTRGGKKRG